MQEFNKNVFPLPIGPQPVFGMDYSRPAEVTSIFRPRDMSVTDVSVPTADIVGLAEYYAADLVVDTDAEFMGAEIPTDQKTLEELIDRDAPEASAVHIL